MIARELLPPTWASSRMPNIVDAAYGYNAIGLVQREDKTFAFHRLPVLGWLVSDTGNASPITHFPINTLAIQEPDGVISNSEGDTWDSADKFIKAWNRKQRNKKGV